MGSIRLYLYTAITIYLTHTIYSNRKCKSLYSKHTYPNKVLTRPYTVTTKSSFLSVGHDFGTEKMDPL